jgi:DNA repair photolyase
MLVLPGLRLVEVRVNGLQQHNTSRLPLGNGDSALPGLLGDIPSGKSRTEATLPVLDTRARDAIFYEQPVGSIINPPESTGMGFWSINPYVGCEFGCTYCYARFTHQYTVEKAEQSGKLVSTAMGDYRGDDGWKAFEHRIFVKRKESVLAALERDLVRVQKRRAAGESIEIVLGTATDPYQPAERSYQLSRAILERLTRERGLLVGIISKSPLICRDIDVLTALQRQNNLAIRVSLITTDVRLIKILEARSPMPHARLRGLAKLSAAGLNAGLIVAPVLPGVNDSSQMLDHLLVAGREAGARFAHPAPLRLYPSIRNHFLPVIDRHFPHLATKYREVYRGQGNAPKAYAAALGRRFRRIAAQYGIPVEEPRLHETSSSLPNQLALWPSR